jgi:putative hemolysin
MTAAQREAVRQRAGGRCEYCRLPDSAMEPEDFHVEHIIAKKHGGPDDADNLAWACIFCNLYKGPNLASLDPETGALTRLFHPRSDRWEDHFRQDGALIVGLTAVGRTTCWLLEMNSEVLSTLRTGLIREGQW